MKQWTVTVTVKTAAATATAVYCDTVKLLCSREEHLMIDLPFLFAIFISRFL